MNYSCFGSRDMFWSGSTAIDDLSRSDKGISGDGAAEALATHSVAASGAVISRRPLPVCYQRAVAHQLDQRPA